MMGTKNNSTTKKDAAKGKTPETKVSEIPKTPETETPEAPKQKTGEKVSKPEQVTFVSRYARDTFNFDGVPKIEFKPVSKDPDDGGIFKTTNPAQIDALRESKSFERGHVTEVKADVESD
jgi:hypothetical protein